ncbi:unnamed protein product, partial [Amoebophrya sp. A120]|eukprot:GSA120T00026410001.1
MGRCTSGGSSVKIGDHQLQAGAGAGHLAATGTINTGPPATAAVAPSNLNLNLFSPPILNGTSNPVSHGIATNGTPMNSSEISRSNIAREPPQGA